MQNKNTKIIISILGVALAAIMIIMLGSCAGVSKVNELHIKQTIFKYNHPIFSSVK